MARVLIAGAGLGGLTAALALIRYGHEIRIFEQARDLKEIGAGVQLGANGTRVLIALGLEAGMRDVVCAATGKEVRLWSTGQAWPVFDLGETSVARFGAPYWMVHRGDFHSVLRGAVQHADPMALRTAATVTGYNQDADSVILHLANGETVEGDVLIAADGVHSCIRGQMFGQGRTRFTGLVAWRGLVSMERLPAHQRRLVGANWVGVGGHVVTYPLRRGELLNFVGVVERDDWQVESWTEAGSTEECLRDLGHWHEDVRTIIRAIDTPFKWALLGREPLSRFTEGRVCLLGDAAHPTLPFLAQGANMALEDAAILARCLDATPNVATALLWYEHARVDRTARIVRGATENTKRFHNPALGDPAGAAAYVEREFTAEKIAARYDWLYDYDALTVPLGRD